MIMKITFENEQGEYTVFLKQEDAIEMIKNTPALSGLQADAKTDKTHIFSDAIFAALKIDEP